MWYPVCGVLAPEWTTVPVPPGSVVRVPLGQRRSSPLPSSHVATSVRQPDVVAPHHLLHSSTTYVADTHHARNDTPLLSVDCVPGSRFPTCGSTIVGKGVSSHMGSYGHVCPRRPPSVKRVPCAVRPSPSPSSSCHRVGATTPLSCETFHTVLTLDLVSSVTGLKWVRPGPRPSPVSVPPRFDAQSGCVERSGRR